MFIKSGEVYDFVMNFWSFVEELWMLMDVDIMVNLSLLVVFVGNLYGVYGKEVVVYFFE